MFSMKSTRSNSCTSGLPNGIPVFLIKRESVIWAAERNTARPTIIYVFIFRPVKVPYFKSPSHNMRLKPHDQERYSLLVENRPSAKQQIFAHIAVQVIFEKDTMGYIQKAAASK